MNGSSGKLLQTVIVPIAALVALAMGVVVAFIWFSAATQDRIAFEKSVEAVQTAMQRRHGAIGAHVTDYAWWNDAVEHLDLALDEAWADVNVGAYQYESYEIELSLVVDRNNRTIFARLDGEPTELGAFEILPARLDQLIREARATPTKAAIGVLPFRDGLAFVAAGAVTPYSPETIQLPEGRIVLVFAKMITQELLDELADPLPLTDLRFAEPDATLAAAATLPLVSPSGDLLARLVWRPHQPGTEFLRAVTPALAVAILVIAAFTYAVLRHAREATTAIEASEARFRDVADASSDWIWEVDAALRLTFISERYALVTGRPPEVHLGMPLAELFHAGESPERWRQHLENLARWQPFRNVLSLCEDAKGIHRTVRLAGKPIRDRAGKEVGYRGTATDITAEIEADRRAQYLALHDPLTDLPNRELLNERLEQAIAAVSRRGDMAALLLLDLDRFKDINDTLGHPAGDLLLKHVLTPKDAGGKAISGLAFCGFLARGSGATITRFPCPAYCPAMRALCVKRNLRMPKPTPIWALVRRLAPGESCTHATCRGPDYSLRFRRRATGVYAEVLFKDKRGWHRHALERVPVSDAEVEAALRALALECPQEMDLYRGIQEEELYRGIEDRALARVRQLRAGRSPSGSFAAAVSDFLAQHGRGLASRTRVEYSRYLERFSSRWGARPLAAITYRDIEGAFHELTDTHGEVAANRGIGALRSFFTWAVKTHRLTAAPIMPDAHSEQRRQRWLTDTELRRLWPALEALGYPTGSWCQLMLLTGTRREDAADLRWADIDDGTWQLRQKKSGALTLIPLGPMARALLAGLPKRGEYVFGGRRPLRGYHWFKMQVNRALGEPPLADWRFHDLRRTVRTNLSRLGVLPHVAELVIGHAPAGLIRVYDLHDFISEKRHALEMWEAHLGHITAPPATVTRLYG